MANPLAAGAGFKFLRVVLYQSNATMEKRLGEVKPLAEYMNKIRAVCEASFVSGQPESLDVVIVVKPNGKTRVWFISSVSEAPDRVRLKQAIEALVPPPVKEGPFAFALSYDLYGAERKQPGEGKVRLPIPEEWQSKAKSIKGPGLSWDGFISLVWPEE